MIIVPPNLVGIVLAHRMLIDPKGGEISLIGIFQHKDFPSFPTPAIEMVAFAMVNGGRGEGTFELAVYLLDESGDHESEDWIYRKRKRHAFPIDDPNRVLNIEIPIKSLRFPGPGDYLFVLSLEGEPVTERRLFVRKV